MKKRSPYIVTWVPIQKSTVDSVVLKYKIEGYMRFQVECEAGVDSLRTPSYLASFAGRGSCQQLTVYELAQEHADDCLQQSPIVRDLRV